MVVFPLRAGTSIRTIERISLDVAFAKEGETEVVKPSKVQPKIQSAVEGGKRIEIAQYKRLGREKASSFVRKYL